MKLTKNQIEDIKNQQQQNNSTKRVTVRELEERYLKKQCTKKPE